MVFSNGLRWQRLSNSDINQLVALFEHSQASVWILAAAHTDSIQQALQQRMHSDQENQSLSFAVFNDQEPIGIAGLSPYKGGGMQSYVYLQDAHWGRGYNQLINQCLAALAFEHLHLKKFVASINVENTRSHKGTLKAFPHCVFEQVYEPWHNRHAWLLHITADSLPTVPLGSLATLAVSAAPVS